MRPGEQRGCPFSIRHVARVGPEIELRKITVQMSLADVVEGSINAALQQREMAFDRVGMMEAPVLTYSSAE